MSEPRLYLLPDYGDHMPIEEFVEMVNRGFFIDYDGSGYYATADRRTRIPAKPSEIKAHGPLWGWTHVVWFNR